MLYKTQESSYDIETAYHVENMKNSDLHGAALPPGHNAENMRMSERAGEENVGDQQLRDDDKYIGSSTEIVPEL